MMIDRSSPGSRVAFRFGSFERLPLRHGMSGRAVEALQEGSVGHARDTDPETIEVNRAAFLREVGVDPADLVHARQTHGTRVQVVTAEDRGRGLFPAFDGFPETDGMVTDDPSVALGVIVADCVPLLLYDRRKHALGVVHAGWKGTVGRIVGEALRTMADAFGTDPADIVAGIGPSIGPCCYEVGPEVLDAWNDAGVANSGRAVVREGSSYHFDLWTANRLVLMELGVPPWNIQDSAVCVRCESDRYFSHRASGQLGRQPGRMLMVAQLNPFDDRAGAAS